VRRLARRLAGLARRRGFAYTRYADDLTFSGNDAAGVGPVRKLAIRIIREEGFEVNPAKTRVARKGSRQRVTGVTVNDVAGLSRKERRLLRAMVHRSRQGRLTPEEEARLRGKLAYLAMLNPAQAAALKK
jgi:retron-type reverse transcriptase